MKRLLFALVLMASLSTAFATDDKHKIPQVVMYSFRQSFGDVEDITTEEVNGLIRIGFKEDNQSNFAYYRNTGELVVWTRQIRFSQLPASLRKDFSKQFDGYTVTDVYQFISDEKSEYYLVLDNSEKHLVLNASSSKWNIFQTVKK